MDAIRVLQQQLAAAQEVSTKNRISERNCIDLVRKLLETDRVKLVHTSNGKEWLTPEQLDREIRDALASNGGRLSIMELPNEVGVDANHCEARVELMRKRDATLSRVHGDLLSAQYLQGIVQEIEEGLEEAGCLSVSELSTRYSLPADYVRSSVLPELSASERNVVKQNTVHTSAYAARVHAKVRGALRGCTRPVVVAQLAQRHRLDPEFTLAAVQTCIHDGCVQGRLQGSTFTPRCYSDGQAERADDFFKSNGYLPLALAKEVGVTLKEWAATPGREGVLLGAAFLSRDLVETALSPISEALACDSWADVRPLLPAALGATEVRDFLQHLVAARRLPPDAVVFDYAVVSQEFLRSVAKSFEPDALAASEGAVATSRGALETAGGEGDDVGAKRKGKRGGQVSKKSGRGDDSGLFVIDAHIFHDTLADRFPEIPGDMCDELFPHVQPLLATMLREARECERSSLHSRHRANFEQAESLVQQRFEALALGLRALEATGLRGSALYPYLLRETVAVPLNHLLSVRWEEETGAVVEVTTANRKRYLKELIAKQGTAKTDNLSRLLSLLQSCKEEKDAQKDPKESKTPRSKRDGEGAEAVDVFHAAADDCHIFCRRVDKKREKSALQEQKVAVRKRLKTEVLLDPVQLCHLGLQLAVLADGVPGLLFPAEMWALRLVSTVLSSEGMREESAALCDLIDRGDDVVALEAKVVAWKDHLLGGGKVSST